MKGATLSPERLETIARMVIGAIHREYPNHVSHALAGDADVRPPRELTPAFYGSFDWHSAVHGHWCLARLARCFPSAPFAGEARAALAGSLTPERLAGEARYLEPRPGFERPYGLAWLLQLAAELRELGDAQGRTWSASLAPLESLAAARLARWLERLPWPVRAGTHGQTAFAMGLALDWARVAGAHDFARLAKQRAVEFFGSDEAAPVAYEPSGHDFLSPILGEADLMRRVLPASDFARWLERLLPDIEGGPARRWLEPVSSPDPSDGHFAHLDGLNLSRAWMLEGIAAGLPRGVGAVRPLLERAGRHASAGLAAVTGEHYAGSHWLGSYAVYLATKRGLG
jgi:hypothetical protein